MLVKILNIYNEQDKIHEFLQRHFRYTNDLEETLISNVYEDIDTMIMGIILLLYSDVIFRNTTGS